MYDVSNKLYIYRFVYKYALADCIINYTLIKRHLALVNISNKKIWEKRHILKNKKSQKNKIFRKF